METSKHPAQGRAGRGRDELAVLQGDREHVPLPQAQFFPECRGQHHPAPVSHAKLECGTHDSRVPLELEGGVSVIPTPGRRGCMATGWVSTHAASLTGRVPSASGTPASRRSSMSWRWFFSDWR